MEKFDAEDTLRSVERWRATHTHMVATMFHRLLALPDDVKAEVRPVVAARDPARAAPTPPHVKKAMMDWLGPILHEYYAATEGGGTFIFADEWLKKPGSVGRPADEGRLEIRDDAGKRRDAGRCRHRLVPRPARGRFEYWKDAQKTQSSYDGDWFTMRDMGYQDEDGYVFLTGRTAELIISGGVNIYPAEIDAVILMHPAVADAAAVRRAERGVRRRGEGGRAARRRPRAVRGAGARAARALPRAARALQVSAHASTSMQSSRAATRARCSAA